jgi:fucose permease
MVSPGISAFSLNAGCYHKNPAFEKLCRRPMRRTRINYPVVILLSSILFEAGLVANATGAVIPDAVADLGLSYSAAALLPFAYFLAYAIVSIPAGILCERTTPKRVILASFGIGLAGLLALAAFPGFRVALGAFFAIGCWLAACQVPLFPLMRAACGGENLAFFTSLTTLLYGVGSILTPRLYSVVTQKLRSPEGEAWPVRALGSLVSGTQHWAAVYWIFAALALLALLVLLVVKLPRLEVSECERSGGAQVYLSLFRRRTVVFYALAVVCYCAIEQGCSNWLSEFLRARHGFNPRTEGAAILSCYWLLLTMGCLGGMAAVKLFDTRKILLASSVLAGVALTGAIFGGREAAIVCFPLIGLFQSVQWPILVELALNSLEEHHGAMMGILMSSVVGGALGPSAIGRVADAAGLGVGMTVLYIPLAFIVYMSLWARPLVANATGFGAGSRSEDLV